MNQKTVIITGSSSGFGYLASLRFARQGFMTFATVKNIESEGAKKLLEIKALENLPLEIVEIDVSKDESVVQGMEKVKKLTNRIDVLINNAGYGMYGPLEEFSISEFSDLYQTNILGTIRMFKEIAPIMRSQKSGLIINMSSISGLVTFPLYGAYSSSKFAIEALSEALRFELSHFDIKVMVVEPGAFATDFSKNKRLPQNQDPLTPYTELTGRFSERYRKKRQGDPEKVADLLLNIVNSGNPGSKYIVGRDAYFYYLAKRILPWQIWEFLLKHAYKW